MLALPVFGKEKPKPQLTVFRDKKTGYTERGFKVRMSLRDAVSLGRRYGQQSIYVDGKGVLDLKTLSYHPQVGKTTGKKALQKDVYTLVPADPQQSVSYDVDFATEQRLKA
jgi:hypothetical protein